jgi:hypothetical protein
MNAQKQQQIKIWSDKLEHLEQKMAAQGFIIDALRAHIAAHANAKPPTAAQQARAAKAAAKAAAPKAPRKKREPSPKITTVESENAARASAAAIKTAQKRVVELAGALKRKQPSDSDGEGYSENDDEGENEDASEDEAASEDEDEAASEDEAPRAPKRSRTAVVFSEDDAAKAASDAETDAESETEAPEEDDAADGDASADESQ